MKKHLSITALVIAALALSACGSEGSSEGTPEEVVPVTPDAVASPVEEVTPEPEPEPEEDRSDRGNLLAKVGDTGFMSDMVSGEEIMQFTVKSIEPVTCTEPYAEPAENGHLIAVDIDVVTTPALADSISPTVYLSGHSWTYFSEEGTRFNGDLPSMATYGCLPESEILPMDIGPGEKASGLILLDVPAKSGTLVFVPDYGDGFEYDYAL